MDLAGSSDERYAGSRSGPGSGGERGSRPRNGGRTRSQWAWANQGAPAREGTEPTSADVDSAIAAAEAADRRQAEYFLSLLTQRRRLVDRRIDEYRKAVAKAETNGDVERGYGYRRMAHSEEQDRQTLDEMIENLQRRFSGQSPGNVSPGAQVRFAAR